VGDDEILKSVAELGRLGLFAEPAGATAYAGLTRACAEGLVQSDQPVMVLNTGSGLKDVKAAMQAVGEAAVIEPTMKALKYALEHSA